MSDDYNKLNAGHYHEVMDRAALMMSTWEREVEKLDATQANPGLKEAATKVGDALSDFYQLAGETYFKMEGDECPTDSKTPKPSEPPTRGSG